MSAMPEPSAPTADIDAARSFREQRNVASFSMTHRLVRLVFRILWLIFAAWTPKQLRWLRVGLLTAFGARIGPYSDVRGTVRIWHPANLRMGMSSVIAGSVEMYNMDMISIGDRVVVSQRAFLCGGTHDYRRADFPLITRPIVIGSDVWIAAEAFVGPGSDIGDGVVIAARAVASGRLEPWSIYAGNPCTRLRARPPIA